MRGDQVICDWAILFNVIKKIYIKFHKIYFTNSSTKKKKYSIDPSIVFLLNNFHGKNIHRRLSMYH